MFYPPCSMLVVNIPCHPLSKKVLLAQYGTEPITLDNHDPLFDILNSSLLRPPAVKNREHYTAQISFALDDRIAEHVNRHAHQIGHRLLRYHKPMLCWFVMGCFRAKGKGAVWAAIEDFLRIHEVDEDEYPTETAYKLFQRQGWKFQEKSPRFSVRTRDKAGVFVNRKKAVRAKLAAPLQPLTISMKDIEVELAVARFLGAYSRCFRRAPASLPKHARVYTYVSLQALTIREAAEKLGMKPTGVQYCLQSIRNRMKKNPTVARLMDESIALPAEK